MTEQSWNLREELEQFNELWLQNPQYTLHHTPESWKVRAKGWLQEITENELQKRRSKQRISESVEYLKSCSVHGGS